MLGRDTRDDDTIGSHDGTGHVVAGRNPVFVREEAGVVHGKSCPSTWGETSEAAPWHDIIIHGQNRDDTDGRGVFLERGLPCAKRGATRTPGRSTPRQSKHMGVGPGRFVKPQAYSRPAESCPVAEAQMRGAIGGASRLISCKGYLKILNVHSRNNQDVVVNVYQKNRGFW